jgi:cystathionine beta-lyase/cystathionine gamma-synthase
MHIETRAIHDGQKKDPATGATIPPIYLSSTYTQEAPGKHLGYEYSRSNNPTRENLEHCLASLESGEAAAAFASGLAACSAVFDLLRPGDGVVAAHDLYGGTFRILDKILRPLGIEVAFASDARVESYAHAVQSLQKPRMIWIETPTNPLLDIIDISLISRLASAHHLLLTVDNTFASPYLQRPIESGADFVVHSTTKYLGGHSDVIGGAVIARKEELLEPIRFIQNARGAVPGPFDCYLTHRGLKTLAVRMRQHCDNAMDLALFLQNHAQVQSVFYPGLEQHPGHALAAQQMKYYGGMLSIVLKGGYTSAETFCRNLRVFSLAESLGGVESLCCHPASMTHASIPREIREKRGINDGLIRLSAGIEHIDDLLIDIEHALDAVTTAKKTRVGADLNAASVS